jgi:zona occludens toxin (predicted ATPase)
MTSRNSRGKQGGPGARHVCPVISSKVEKGYPYRRANVREYENNPNILYKLATSPITGKTPAASQRKILFKSTKKVIPVAVVKKDILAI